MHRSTSAPSSERIRYLLHDLDEEPSTSTVRSLPHDVRGVSLSRHVISRMRLDTTLAPSQLALRINRQNLVNEMLSHDGKALSSQLMLMMNKERQAMYQLKQTSKNGAMTIPENVKNPALFLKVAKQREEEKNRQKRSASQGSLRRGRPGQSRASK
mmetsp:Transcript_54024/g.167653  ORF Transcript_54024/g.167653 Transcript_54024/m.167653 type:complete len:156 (+) Transcript_54024:40-507(+)